MSHLFSYVIFIYLSIGSYINFTTYRCFSVV